MTFVTKVKTDKYTLIESRGAILGEHPSGFGRFTQTIIAYNLRRAIVRAESASSETGA